MAASKSKRHAADGAVAGLEALLADFLAALPPATATPPRICVALSGGRDSIVLLHALARLRTASNLVLSALHVHHGLSAHADDWAAFCIDVCAALELPLSLVRVAVPRASGEGLEGAARRVRHQAFAAADADFVALAHHQGDQAETLLLNLLRGAGVAGAAAMAATRPQCAGPVLVRPLLGVSGQRVADYAAARKLRWIDDESNRNTHFRRNFLRREIVPRLEEKFPDAGEALARAAGHFAEARALLDDLAEIDRAALTGASGRIVLAGFNALTPRRAANLLRQAWTTAGFRAPDSAWLGEALKQLATAGALSETVVANADGALRVYRGEIHLVRHRPLPPAAPLPWRGEGELAWAGGRVVFAEVVGAGIRRSVLGERPCRLQARAGGERLRPHAGRPSRSLRNLLQEAALPPWQRQRLPLFWAGEDLLWVGAIGVDSAFACAPDEAGILPVWHDD